MKNALITIIGAAVLTAILIMPGIQAADSLQNQEAFAPKIINSDGLAPVLNLSFEGTEAQAEELPPEEVLPDEALAPEEETESAYLLHLNDIIIESDDVQLATFDAYAQEAMLDLGEETKRLMPFLMEQLGFEQLPEGMFYGLVPGAADMSLTMGEAKFFIFNNPLATYDENHGLYYVMLYPDAAAMPVGFVTENNPVASILLLLEDQ